MSKDVSENAVSFEQSLDALEKIVTEMEQGDLPLNAALTKFEEGVALAKASQSALENAEQKVKILMQTNDTEQLVDFDPQGDEVRQ